MESLQRFWAVVVEVWNTGIFGVSLERILLAVGIVLLCLLMRGLFIRVASGRLRTWTKRSKTEIDDRVIVVLEQPIGLIPVVLGLFFAAEFLQLSGTLALFAANLIKSLIIGTIFWGFYRLVDPFSFLLRNLERLFTPELVDWLLSAIKVAFVFVGGVAILETWGIQVAPLLAGLGIFGVAVALGAQDLFKNLIAGASATANGSRSTAWSKARWRRSDSARPASGASTGRRCMSPTPSSRTRWLPTSRA
jgi:MscS family membrane protein